MVPGLSQVVLLITMGLVAPPANSGPGGMPPGFQVAARPKDQVLAPGQEYRAALPPLPPRPEKVLLLGFHAVALAPREAGGYYLLAVGFNGTALGATPGGEARLVGRDGALEIRGDPESRTARLFHDNALLLMYAPDVDRADVMAAGGRGATFLFDVSDLVRGGMANELIFRNTRGAGAGPPVHVAVQDVQVGWADRSALPAPPSEVQQRGPIGLAAESEGLRLLQGRGGGFARTRGRGPATPGRDGPGHVPLGPPGPPRRRPFRGGWIGLARDRAVRISRLPRHGRLARSPAAPHRRAARRPSGLVGGVGQQGRQGDRGTVPPSRLSRPGPGPVLALRRRRGGLAGELRGQPDDVRRPEAATGVRVRHHRRDRLVAPAHGTEGVRRAGRDLFGDAGSGPWQPGQFHLDHRPGPGWGVLDVHQRAAAALEGERRVRHSPVVLEL